MGVHPCLEVDAGIVLGALRSAMPPWLRHFVQWSGRMPTPRR
jgi:hypothetical protein